jgi:hypothetical protein
MGSDAMRWGTAAFTGGMSETSGLGTAASEGSDVLDFGKPDNVTNREDYEVPYANDLRTRYLAIIDHYLRRNGIEAIIPPENLPYELRSPEQRADWRDATSTVRPNGTVDKPTLQDGMFFSNPAQEAPRRMADAVDSPRESTGSPRQVDGVRDLPEETKNYQRSAMASRLASENAGVTQEKPLVATPKEFHMQDQARRQEEFDRIHDFINRQRSPSREARRTYGY